MHPLWMMASDAEIKKMVLRAMKHANRDIDHSGKGDENDIEYLFLDMEEQDGPICCRSDLIDRLICFASIWQQRTGKRPTDAQIRGIIGLYTQVEIGPCGERCDMCDHPCH